jgi:hypothetical protein
MLDDYKNIDNSRSRFVEKLNLPWGFAIYRCSYKNESAWKRLLQQLEERIKDDLECNQRMDLLPHHQLVINNDINTFNRETVVIPGCWIIFLSPFRRRLHVC